MKVYLTNSYCKDGIRKNGVKEELSFAEFIKKYFTPDLGLYYKNKTWEKPEMVEIYGCEYEYLFCDDFKMLKKQWENILEEHEIFIESKNEEFIDKMILKLNNL